MFWYLQREFLSIMREFSGGKLKQKGFFHSATAPHILILKSSKISSGLQLDLDIFFFAKILFILHDPVLLLPYLDIYIFFIIFQLYIGTNSLEMTALQ